MLHLYHAGLHQLLDLAFQHKSSNVLVECNFARAAAQRRSAKHTAEHIATMSAKHVLSEVQMEHTWWSQGKSVVQPGFVTASRSTVEDDDDAKAASHSKTNGWIKFRNLHVTRVVRRPDETSNEARMRGWIEAKELWANCSEEEKLRFRGLARAENKAKRQRTDNSTEMCLPNPEADDRTGRLLALLRDVDDSEQHSSESGLVPFTSPESVEKHKGHVSGALGLGDHKTGLAARLVEQDISGERKGSYVLTGSDSFVKRFGRKVTLRQDFQETCDVCDLCSEVCREHRQTHWEDRLKNIVRLAKVLRSTKRTLDKRQKPLLLAVQMGPQAQSSLAVVPCASGQQGASATLKSAPAPTCFLVTRFCFSPLSMHVVKLELDDRNWESGFTARLSVSGQKLIVLSLQELAVELAQQNARTWCLLNYVTCQLNEVKVRSPEWNWNRWGTMDGLDALRKDGSKAPDDTETDAANFLAEAKKAFAAASTQHTQKQGRSAGLRGLAMYLLRSSSLCFVETPPFECAALLHSLSCLFLALLCRRSSCLRNRRWRPRGD
jgi:hypothetical protein